jgi:carbon storage regulator CsrA
MLIITRKVGEELVVPHLNVKVQVLEVTGTAIRLGIVAPAEVSIRRKGVVEATDREHDTLSSLLTKNSEKSGTSST